MVKKFFCSLVLALVILPAGAYGAEGGEGTDGGEVVFRDTLGLKGVVFSHAGHEKAGNVCADCHPGVFSQKTGSSDEAGALNMKAMQEGRFCGACHDGKAAFSVMSRCEACHSAPK